MARSGLYPSTAIGLAMAAFACLFSLTGAGNRLENEYALDLLYGVRGPLPAPAGAVVIALDTDTIDWLHDAAAAPDKNPWLSCIPADERSELAEVRGPTSLPRSFQACLLDALRRLGFPVVAFDIMFAVPGAEADDQRLADALKAHGGTAILVGIDRSTVRDGASELMVEREVLPLPLFRASAAATGTFLLPKTGGPVYGYFRRVPAFPETRSLPSELFRLWQAHASDASPPPPGSDDGFQYLWLYGPPASVLTASARDILSGAASDAVRSAASTSAAFVGASDPDTADYPDSFPSFFRSPTGSDISGVELAATAFLNLRAGETLRRPPVVAGLLLTALFAFALGFLARARTGYAMLAVPVISLAYVGAAAFAFMHLRVLPPIATPVFVVAPMVLLVAIFIRYRFARALLMRLAPAPAARRMLLQPTDQRGEAVAHEATVVFFDLIGSTAIAEKIAAVDFNTLLNAYFDAVAAIVEREHGQISAFSGDGITAIFAGTTAHANHAARACAAVVAAIHAIQRANDENAKKHLPPLHVRVGLNSGDVAEGEIGARDRFNFSVVGDAVNLAARLEQMGKTLFPGEVDVALVGEMTHRMAAGPGLEFLDCGLCEIRGRERPEQVYRLVIG